MTEFRKPTHAEAVAWVLRKEHLNSYRKACIAFWREQYGDEYADAIRKEALEKHKGDR